MPRRIYVRYGIITAIRIQIIARKVAVGAKVRYVIWRDKSARVGIVVTRKQIVEGEVAVVVIATVGVFEARGCPPV